MGLEGRRATDAVLAVRGAAARGSLTLLFIKSEEEEEAEPESWGGTVKSRVVWILAGAYSNPSRFRPVPLAIPHRTSACSYRWVINGDGRLAAEQGAPAAPRRR